MAITELRPKIKLTVGAQYICFNEGDANGDWDEDAFESDVSKFPTVVQASITDEADSYDVYASGAVYDSDANVISRTIAVTTALIANHSKKLHNKTDVRKMMCKIGDELFFELMEMKKSLLVLLS